MDHQEFRRSGHRVVDLLADYLERVADRPLFPKVEPRALHEMFDGKLPSAPSDLDGLIGELEKKLLPNSTHVNHPGYFGLITPSPNPAGILADFIASALNQNVGAYTIGPAAVAIERRAVRWLCDLAGYGPKSGGNLTSGGMMANFVGLKLARDWAGGDRDQHEGVTARWAAYTSEERHVSVDKAADCIGIGREGLRSLPTDDRFRLRLDALEAAIARDKAEGIRPMCIVAMAGSTNTGSIDDLKSLRRIADREKMWLHADAAYGGGMLLSREHPGLLDGLAEADSITIDPHKWFYAPLDAGAVLVRDETRLTASFGISPPYLTDEKDTHGERYNYFVHSLEQSRRFRGLKVWMAFKRYGSETIGAWVDANVKQAMRLHDLAGRHPSFVTATRPVMSAVCLRFQPPGVDDEALLAALHVDVARRIEESGRFWISTTRMKDKAWFRVNPVNLNTRTEDMDALFAMLIAECDRALAATS